MEVATGHLVLVVGPSGAGKDAVMMGAKAALQGEGNVIFPRRFVTRLSNPHAEDHVSMTEMEFAMAVADGAFALWWRAHGNSYGIGRFVESHLGLGTNVVVNCSRASVQDARNRFANVVVVEISAPEDLLVARIVSRGRESAEEARSRVLREVPAYPPDIRVERIVNEGPLDQAVDSFCALLRRLNEPPPAVEDGSPLTLRAS